MAFLQRRYANSPCQLHRVSARRLLAVEVGHLRRRVAIADDRMCRDGLIDAGQVFGSEQPMDGSQRFAQAIAVTCADQRDNVFTTTEHPGDGDLGNGGILRRGDGAQLFDQLEVALQVAPWNRGACARKSSGVRSRPVDQCPLSRPRDNTP